MATNGTETFRIEARLTLMVEMLQRAADEARQLVDAYAEELRAREQGRTPPETPGEDTNVG